MSLSAVLDRVFVKNESPAGRRTLKRAKTKHARRGARQHINQMLEVLEAEEAQFPRRAIETPVPRPRVTLQMFIRQNNLLPV